MESIFKQIRSVPDCAPWPHLHTCSNPNWDLEADKDYVPNIIHMKMFTKELITKWQLVIKRDKNGLWKVK